MTEKESSVEFLITRSTDPYLTAAERDVHFKRLLVKVGENCEAPQIAFQLLSHKLLSPDQHEVFNTLEVLDDLVRQGGSEIAEEVGKFKFLNNFIRILSNKYQGCQTSGDVRNKTIELLFIWKNSLKHLDKVQEVYDLLKRQNVIEADPVLPKPVLRKETTRCSPRIASFEDDEKSRLLASLLRSKRPEDLQAANRMIKCMVNAEDKKIEKVHKQHEVFFMASNKTELLMKMMEEERNMLSLLDGNYQSTSSTHKNGEMKNLYESLILLRPILFRYASEETDFNEAQLEKLLALNDGANRAIQLFREMFAEENTGKKKAVIHINCREADQCSSDQDALRPPNDDDMLALCSPILSRRRLSPSENSTPISDDVVEDLLPNVNGNRETKSNGLQEIDLLSGAISKLNFTLPNEVKDNEVEKTDQFLLEDVKLDITDLQISPVKPLVLVNENQLQLIFYFAKTKNVLTQARIKHAVVTLSSTNPLPIADISLTISPTNTLVSSRLVNTTENAFDGFNPIASAKPISRPFHILPLLDSIEEVDLRYLLNYKIEDVSKKCSGSCKIYLKDFL